MRNKFKKYHLKQSAGKTGGKVSNHDDWLTSGAGPDQGKTGARPYRFSNKQIGLAAVVLILMAVPLYFLITHYLEKSAYENALAEDSVEGYEKFMERFPKSDQIDQIKDLHQESLFSEAERTESIKGFEKYLELYPNGVHGEQAAGKVEELSFETARQEGSMEKLEKYLEKYPEGRFIREAQYAMDLLRLQKDDDNNYARAIREDTVEAYIDYLDYFPNGRRREEIRTLLVKKATKEIVRECNLRSDRKKLVFLLEALGNYAPDVFPDVAKMTSIKPLVIHERQARDPVNTSDLELTLYKAGLFYICPQYIEVPKYTLFFSNYHRQYDQKDYTFQGKYSCSMSCSETTISADLVYPDGRTAFNLKSSGKSCPASTQFRAPVNTRGGDLCQYARAQLVNDSFSRAWKDFIGTFTRKASDVVK